MRIWIPTKFPNLNDYINKERANRFAGAKMKKDWTSIVESASVLAMEMGQRYEGFYPATVTIVIHEPNKRRDVDNVSAFVGKVSLDGMVKAGVIPDDSQKYIKKVIYEVVVDGEVGVEIIL